MDFEIDKRILVQVYRRKSSHYFLIPLKIISEHRNLVVALRSYEVTYAKLAFCKQYYFTYYASRAWHSSLFFASNRTFHENRSNSAAASNQKTVTPSAPPILPTLPPTGPSPTPEDPNAHNSEVPILTPRVRVPVTVPTPVPSDPYEVTISRDRDIFDPKEITKMSEVIVVGTIRKVMPARWTTADGKRPINPHAPDNTHTIYTPVLIDVELPIKGLQDKQSLILFAWGGVIGSDSAKSSTDTLYTFNQGDRVAVFLNKQGSTLNSEPLWNIIEHYNIDGQGNADNGYQSISLQKLLEDIRSAL